MEETQNSRFAEDAPLEIYITVLAKMPKGATPEEQARMFNGRANNAKTPDLNKITKIVCEALDAAAYLGIKTVTLRNWIKKKPDVPAHRAWGNSGSLSVLNLMNG